MWPYIEYILGTLLRSQRGRDAKLFHKGLAFIHQPEKSLEVTSSDCGPSSSHMSNQYGKDGENQFPALSWQPPRSDAATRASAKDYLLILEDPDAPLPSPVVHGVYYAFPSSTLSIDASNFERVEEDGINDLKGGFKFGQNRMITVYGGPRPVQGHGPHRYFYQVVALDERLALKPPTTEKPTREELAKAVDGKVLAWGVWVGVFERKS